MCDELIQINTYVPGWAEGECVDPGDPDTEKSVRIPTMDHSYMPESPTFPRVHVQFYYTIQCQNSPGLILLAKAMSESLWSRNVFHQTAG